MTNIEELTQAHREIAELKADNIKLCELIKQQEKASFWVLKIDELESKLARAIELIDCTSDKWGRCNCKPCQFLETLKK